jgi:hypothetical protein
LKLLGDLPQRAESVVQVPDLVTEVCQDQAFSPTFPLKLPEGYRLAELRDMAAQSGGAQSWMTQLLREHPRFGSYAFGTFCVCEATFAVDGTPVHSDRLTRFAMWWVYVAPTGGSAQPDPRERGKPRRMQLAWLYDEENIDRKLATAIMPAAEFGRISLEKKQNTWSLQIEANHSTATANVTLTSTRKPLEHATPAFETVLLADSVKDQFLVLTYAGHHEQPATGEWRATGNAPWALAFQGDPLTVRRSMIQDGWVVRLARYKRL